jgi:hypothetical protein
MRISHSAKETYATSSMKYFLHYLLKLRPTGYKSPLAFGDSIDISINTLLETRDVDLAKVKFQERWNFYKDKEVKYSKSDYDEHLLPERYDTDGTSIEERTWITLAERGLIMIQEYNEQVMPRIKEVIKVQIDQTAANELGDELVIKTDMIVVWEDDRRILFDNKTTSVAYLEDSVMNSQQLAIYYETLKQEYNLDACGFIVIPKRLRKKKLPVVEIKVIIDQVSQDTIDTTLQSYDDTLANIKAAKFSCDPDNCGSVFGPCEYRGFCKHGDMEGLEYKK